MSSAQISCKSSVVYGNCIAPLAFKTRGCPEQAEPESRLNSLSKIFSGEVFQFHVSM